MIGIVLKSVTMIQEIKSLRSKGKWPGIGKTTITRRGSGWFSLILWDNRDISLEGRDRMVWKQEWGARTSKDIYLIATLSGNRNEEERGASPWEGYSWCCLLRGDPSFRHLNLNMSQSEFFPFSLLHTLTYSLEFLILWSALLSTLDLWIVFPPN